MEKSPDAFRTISEVAVWLETPAHVLRFWESRFPQLKPIKRAGGRRYYRPADMALLGGIKKLLHEDGLTIRGVQKILREQGVRHVATLSGTLDAAELGALLEHDDFPADDPEDAAGIALDVAELPLDQSPGSNVFALPASAVPVGELSRGGRPARTVPATAIPVPADPAPPLGALGLSPDPAPLAGPDGLADEADGEDRSRSLWSDRSAAAVPDPDRDEGQSEDGPQQAPLAPPASYGAFAPSGQAGAEDPAPLGDADTATSIATVVPDAVASGDGEPAADHRLPVVGDAGAVADAPPEDIPEPVALPEPVPPPPVPSPVPRTDPGTRADAAPDRVPLAILLRRLPDSPDPAALGALRALADRLGALRGRLGPQQD